MPTSISGKRFSQFSSSFDSNKAPRIARREFLHGIMIGGVGIFGIATSMEQVFAQPPVEAGALGALILRPSFAHRFDGPEAWREALSIYPLLAQQFDDENAWRDQVQNLTSTLDASLGRDINPEIRNANLVERPKATDTHTAYASRLIFNGWNLQERTVVCDNAYAIKRFPLYDVSCTCEKYRDLNYAEIGSFISSYEYNRFGCVLVPAGPRLGFGNTEYNDHAMQDFRNTVRQRYNREPKSYHVHYHRAATTHKRTKTRRVFLATNISEGAHEVFIGDEDI